MPTTQKFHFLNPLTAVTPGLLYTQFDKKCVILKTFFLANHLAQYLRK